MVERHTNIPLPQENVDSLCNELMSPDTTHDRLEDIKKISELVGVQDHEPRQETRAIDFSTYPPRLLTAFLENRNVPGSMKDEIARQVLERRSKNKNVLYQGH